MTTILEVVVGSRLHNLHKPESDYDIRGIFMHPVEDIISPFKTIKNTSWIEGDVDNTAYELREFCKMAVHGNPTILEILYSNLVNKTSDIGERLRFNRDKFLDSHRIFEAYKGYAHNQYNKMNLFEPDARTPKFAVSYLRSLYQGAQLLKTGDFDQAMTGDFRDFLLAVKNSFTPKLIPELSRKFSEMQVALSEAYYANHDKFKPDIPWIEEFLNQSYLKK